MTPYASLVCVWWGFGNRCARPVPMGLVAGLAANAQATGAVMAPVTDGLLVYRERSAEGPYNHHHPRAGEHHHTGSEGAPPENGWCGPQMISDMCK